METLNNILKEIKAFEDEKTLLENKIKDKRQEVFNILESEKMQQYKNPEIATVSYVERKSVKYEDVAKTLDYLKENNLVKYYNVVPEHEEINAKLEKDIKDGAFNMDGVFIEVKKLPQIRFVD